MPRLRIALLARAALALALALALAGVTLVGPRAAAETRPQPPRAPVAAPGTVTGRDRLPPPASSTVHRIPRSFAFCNAEARKRRYRGSERRHFVQRCRLGYGVRLFPRRRTEAPAGPPAGPPTADRS